jgi:GNAT superfamily N-acetyltransferase
MQVTTVRERPELVERAWELTRDTLPEYNNHGHVLNVYWPRLVPELPEFQFHLVDDDDEPLARARSIPIRWNGTVEDLPKGIDGAIARGFDERGANTLCAMIVQVRRDRQRGGVSRLALEAMVDLARRNGFAALIAPVRPSWKERYPLTPIERYATWTRGDGLPFDPWMRVHARLGATILKPEPESLHITGSVAEWQDWTGLELPEDGDYVFPAGLALLRVSDGRAEYWEPNVWMLHVVSA